MRTEREKMLAGEMYDPTDVELVEARVRARDLCMALNATSDRDVEDRRRILVDLFAEGRIGARAVIGAGSVVTRDIPSDTFAAGNPCRVIRKIEP